MSTERAHAHDSKHDDEHLHHDARGVGHRNEAAMLHAPINPIASGLIARKRDTNGVAEGADAAIATASGSSGSALPAAIQRKFESSLGADLSSVRVHTGAESQTAASAVGAKAYTMGQDIHFGAGQYDPSSGAGEHLLAHEVAHTVQQGGGSPTRQNKLEVSTPFDPAEHEADTAADAMVAGRSASVSFGSGVARKVMREAAEGGEAGDAKGDGSIIGAAGHLVIPLNGEQKPIDMGYGELTVEGTLTIDVESPGEPPVSVGPTVGKDGFGAEVETKLGDEHELDGGYMTVKSVPKLGVHVTTKEIAVEVTGELALGNSAVPGCSIGTNVGLEIVKIEREKFLKEGFHSVEVFSLQISDTGSKEFTLASGKKVKVTGDGTVTLSPNWRELGKQVAEDIAKSEVGQAISNTAKAVASDVTDAAAVVLTAEVLVPTALVVGGMATIGVALYQIAQSDQFTELTEPEVRKLRAYCMAYQQAMRGQPMDGGAEGAAAGYADGLKNRQLIESTTPNANVANSSSGLDLYSAAWNKGWPPVRAKIEAAYWDEHYIEHAVYGPEGSGGGFHVLKMLLDGWDRP